MIPIRKLLDRIRWDPGFGKAGFTIGYYDRTEDRVVRVPLGRIRFAAGEHFSFDAVEDNGEVHSVPLHRVREVWRDGELIWERRPQVRKRS